MPRSVNHVASRNRRKKILSLTRGNLVAVLMFGQLPKTLGRKVSSTLIAIVRTKNALSVHCGFNVSTPLRVWRV